MLPYAFHHPPQLRNLTKYLVLDPLCDVLTGYGQEEGSGSTQ